MRSMLSLCAVCVLASTASADDYRGGIGLGVGVATGPNLQLETSRWTHLDLGLGIDLDERLRFQIDHAWRFAEARGRNLRVPFYLGIGGFVTDRRDGDSDAGLRMPIGLQLEFRAPVQVFGEVAPELAVIRVRDGRMDPPPDLALTGLMGVRAAF